MKTFDEEGAMKKYYVAVCVLFLIFGLGGFAGATPYTWVDTFDPCDIRVGWFDSLKYEHDLTDNTPVPFAIGEDFIYSYSLTVRLYDDGGFLDLPEIAYINQPGLLGDGFYDFSYENRELGWSLAGLIELNLLGQLSVSIDSWFGDFYFDYSQLTARGENNAPVPEPATMLLLGSGLIGLAGFGRKRFRKR
jgi:hypothetical protein